MLSILQAHREMDLGVLATKAEVSLRRAAAIVEGLERGGLVHRHCPDPEVTLLRITPRAPTGLEAHKPPVETPRPAKGGGRH